MKALTLYLYNEQGERVSGKCNLSAGGKMTHYLFVPKEGLTAQLMNKPCYHPGCAAHVTHPSEKNMVIYMMIE